MPFTPLHLGPGAAFKVLGGRHFSFLIFAGAQVLMDLEPGIQMLRGAASLHSLTHNLIGAALIGTLAALIGRPVCNWVLSWLHIEHRPILTSAVVSGAYLGTFSHIGIDALMHYDVSPLAPLITGNPIVALFSVEQIHLACWLVGLLAGLWLAAQAWFQHKTTKTT